jgi:hypothetical protein
MNDRDILRHDRLDRINTFGSENHSDLPAGCEAIARFANVIDLDEPGFIGFYRLPRRTQPATQEGRRKPRRRHHPCHLISIDVSVKNLVKSSI